MFERKTVQKYIIKNNNFNNVNNIDGQFHLIIVDREEGEKIIQNVNFKIL